MPLSHADSFGFDTYLSAFTNRYGTSQMRKIWSEKHKRKLWRKVWTALATAQEKAGVVTKEELNDIIKHQNNLDISASKKTEQEIYHELMSELLTFTNQAKIGGGKLHAGATGADILDNANILQIQESLRLIKTNLLKLLDVFAQKITEYQDTICMGYTHLQPAEPTTLGYRLAFYAQDLLLDLQTIQKLGDLIKGKGIKGAVGTSASFTTLLGDKDKASQLEKDVLQELGINAVTISGQTYPRKIDLLAIEFLTNIAASLHKFCFDYRIMQSPQFGEWVEIRDEKRVGSSAMPFKRNPDKAEKVCSLCRYTASLFPVAWSNPAMSLLERTLDDTASQRLFLPEGFLAIDECLITTQELLEKLQVKDNALEKNLKTYGVFAATEKLLMTLTKKGANRQEMHEVIKNHSMTAWKEVEQSGKNPLATLLANDPVILKFITQKEVAAILDPSGHIGLTKERVRAFLKTLEGKVYE